MIYRAKPFEVILEPYKAGMEDGFVAIEDTGEIALDHEGYELTTENFPADKLQEKVLWAPGQALRPFFYYRSGRLVWQPNDLIVTYNGGVRMPISPADAAYMFEEKKDE